MARHNRNRPNDHAANTSADDPRKNGCPPSASGESTSGSAPSAGHARPSSSPQRAKEESESKHYVRRVNGRFVLLVVGVFAVLTVGIHFLHAHQVERNADRLIERADAAREAGDPQKAISLLSQYVRFRPDDVDALAELGTLIDENARSPREVFQAYLALDQVLRDDSDRADASAIRRRLAELAVKLRRYRDAAEVYLPPLLKETPADAELLSYMAVSQAGLGHFGRSVVYSLQAISADPANVDYYLPLVQLVRSHSDELLSQTQIDRLKGPAESPDYDPLLAELDLIRPDLLAAFPVHKNDVWQIDEIADKLLARLIEDGRPAYRALLARAEYYRGLDRFDEANADVEAAIATAGEEPDVLVVAAELAIARSQAHRLQGDEEAAKGDLQSAREFVEQGKQLAPDDVRFYAVAAQLHQRNNEWDEAADSLREGLKLLEKDADKERDDDQPDNSAQEMEFRWQLADVLISAAERPGAEPDPQLIEQANDQMELLQKTMILPALVDYHKARIELADRRRHAASRLLERARPQLQSFPELVKRIDLLLGSCYAGLANPDAQLAVYRRALKADPLWVAGRIELGAALASAGRIDEAIEDYRALLPIAPVVSVELARLLIIEQLALPQDRRQWDPVAHLLTQMAEQLKTELPQVTILRAEVLLLQGQPAEAETMLRDACKRSPDETSYPAALARLELRRSDVDEATRYERAVQVLDEAQEQSGLSSDLQQARASATRLLAADRALETLKAVEESAASLDQPGRDQLIETLAREYASRAETAKARALWQSLAAGNPQDLGPQLALIQFDLIANDDAAFQKTLGEIRRIEGDDGPHGNYFEASSLMSQAASDAALLADPARLQTALKKPRELLRRTQQERATWPAVRRAQGDLDYLLAKAEEAAGKASLAADHRKQAVDAYRQALELGERSQTMIGRIVEYYQSTGQNDEANLVLRQIGDQNPELISGELARQASRVAWSRQQYDEAIGMAGELANKSGDVRDKIWQANLMAAKFRQLPPERQLEAASQPQLQKILDLYREAVDMAPNEPSAWLAYVLNLQQHNRGEEARRAVHEAAEKLPDQPPELKPLTLARLNDVVGAKEQAGKLYEIAVAAAPENMTVRFLAAEFFYRNGDEAKVQQQLDYILDPANKAPQVAINLARRTKAMVLAKGGGYPETTQALQMLQQPFEGASIADIPPDDLRAQAAVLARRPTPTDRSRLQEILEELSRRRLATPAELFQLARLYEATYQWPKADKLFKTLLEEKPTDLILIGYYAQGLIRQKRLVDALPLIQRFDQITPDSFAGAMLHALYAAADGKKEDAVSLLETYFDAHKPTDSPDQAVRELLAQNDAEDALVSLENSPALKDDPAALKAVAQGRSLLQQGDTEAAVVALRQVMARQDIQRAVDAYYRRAAAQVLASLQLYDGAERLYRQYMEMSQKPEDVLTLAAFVTHQGRIDEALRLCQQAWDTCPAAAVANTSVAVLRVGDPTPEQIERVALWLQEAIQQDPAAAAPLVHLADLYDLQGRYDEAVPLYRQALMSHPHNVMALNNLAWLCALRGLSEGDDPLKLIDHAIEVGGPHSQLLDTKGFVLLKLGQTAKAVDVLKQAIATSSSAGLLHFHLAQAYLEQGETRQAQRQFAKAIELGLVLDDIHPLEQAAFKQLQTQ